MTPYRNDFNFYLNINRQPCDIVLQMPFTIQVLTAVMQLIWRRVVGAATFKNNRMGTRFESCLLLFKMPFFVNTFTTAMQKHMRTQNKGSMTAWHYSVLFRSIRSLKLAWPKTAPCGPCSSFLVNRNTQNKYRICGGQMQKILFKIWYWHQVTACKMPLSADIMWHHWWAITVKSHDIKERERPKIIVQKH